MASKLQQIKVELLEINATISSNQIKVSFINYFIKKNNFFNKSIC